MSDSEFSQNIGQQPPPRTDGGRPLLDRVFEALAHQRRRYILYYMREHNQSDVDDLATHIAAWEQNMPVEEVLSDATEQLQTELVHTHLPKLDDYGLVEYDRRSKDVCYTHPPTQLERVLDVVTAIEKPG